MAIHPMEEEIVKNYVVKNRQERILWELSSPRKRSGIMWRHFPGVRLFKAECLQATDHMPPSVMEKRLNWQAPNRFITWAQIRLANSP